MSKRRLSGRGMGFLPVALAVSTLFLAAGCQTAAPAPPAATAAATRPAATAAATTAPTAPAATATTAPAQQPTAPAATATTAPPPPAPTATTAPPPPTPTATTAPAQPAAGDPARGQQVFASICNACHPNGQQGVGPSLAGVTGRLSDAQITQQVRQGRGQMPAVGASFSDQQMGDLLAYLKRL